MEPKMPNLDSEPANSPRTLDELLALAHAMESDAAARYTAFAAAMSEQGRDELAAVFAMIAQEELGHVAGVDAWSRAQLGHPPATRAAGPPALPAMREEEETEIAGSTLLSPYRALSIAVRNEERAFAFWAYLAAHAERQDVREAAERMASEELTHAAVFRRERRRAFHRERAAGTVRVTVAEGELRLAAMLREAAGAPLAASEATGTDDLAETVRRTEGAQALQVCVSPATTPAQLAEELADAYVTAVVTVSEAAGEWQSLAERAMKRAAAIAARARNASA